MLDNAQLRAGTLAQRHARLIEGPCSALGSANNFIIQPRQHSKHLSLHFILPCMPDARVVTCPQCGTKFGTAKSLDVHRCPECFARFSKSDLKVGGWLPIVASALIVLAFILLVVLTWP